MNDFRYFAYHNTGLHAISVNFIHQLENFVNSDKAEELPLLTATSRAEYLVCTKAINSGKINPVLGFTVFRSPAGMIAFLSTGQVISLDLITDPSLIRGWPVSKPPNFAKIDNKVNEMLKESFTNQIQAILKSNVSQPILKLDKSTNPTPQESFELLMQATQVFREQYFSRLDKVRQEIEKRVTALQVLKEQQLNEIQLLEKEKESIRDKAEQLAEIYEDVGDKQQSLLERAQDLVRLATLRLPQTSTQEKEFANNLEKIKTKADMMLKQLEKAKLRMKTQEDYKETNVAKTDRKIVLPNNKDETIRKILTEM